MQLIHLGVILIKKFYEERGSQCKYCRLVFPRYCTILVGLNSKFEFLFTKEYGLNHQIIGIVKISKGIIGIGIFPEGEIQVINVNYYTHPFYLGSFECEYSFEDKILLMSYISEERIEIRTDEYT